MTKNIERVNEFFEKIANLIIKFRWFIIVFIILLFAFASIGFVNIKFDNAIEGWFLKKSDIKIEKDKFEKIFGNSDFVALLIESDDVFKPEILKLLNLLGTELEYNVPYVDKVISLSNIEYSYADGDDIIIEELVGDNIPVNNQEIEIIRNNALSKKSMLNRIVSDDSKMTWLVVRLYAFPEDWEQNQKNAVNILKDYRKSKNNMELDYSNDMLILIIEELNEKFVKNNIYLNSNEIINKYNTIMKKYTFLKKLKNHILFSIIKNEIIKQTDSPSNRVGAKVLEIINQKKYKNQNYSIKAAGMPVFGIEDLRLGERHTGILTLFSIVISIIVLIIFLRSLRGILIPLISTISSITIVFGFMCYFGVKINAIMMSVPVFLGFAVSIGYSIHIFNVFKREFLKTGDRKHSVVISIKQTGWPLFFTALTTIGSLISFVFIELVPLRWLGITSALIVLSVFLIVITLTPALLSFGKNREPLNAELRSKKFWSDKYFNKLGKIVLNTSVPIFICFIIITGVLIFGMTKTRINLNTKKTYGKNVSYINRLNYIAGTKVGSFSSYDLAIDLSSDNRIKEPDVLRKFDVLSKEISQLQNTKKISSILDIVKDMYQLFNENNPKFYSVPDTREQISSLLFLYEMSGGTEVNMWVDNEYSILRLMVEMEDMDTKQIIKELNYVRDRAAVLFPDAKITITGSMPEFAALNQYLSVGQVQSYLIALFIIMILMMIVFRSIKIGLIGMIPNITPAIAVGGLMGLFNIPLDFVTVTMVPMLLGLAVDDTIHFISHARVDYFYCKNYNESIYSTFRVVGKALFMTSFIIVAAFSVYLISNINMFRNLGIFLIAGIGSALLADYLITPIMIKWLKPFGNPDKENKK